ncbi:hypothetical protein E4K67_23715 [Desulfosporosinus fructosivorans]|uniref:Uncharacterized protein n=2 Tax=Desulfosporosinus fructosivorans TaxID=2018669 RepID=A0A4Z0QYB8_9FIRM|nr:hypothetical protein E4K67_23715 [Desulfosporosinus fructosivorans]
MRTKLSRERRIITAAMDTSGEKHDGKQLQELVEKSEEAGIEVSFPCENYPVKLEGIKEVYRILLKCYEVRS